MFKNIIAFVVLALLSGCAFMTQDQSLNQTLQAVSNSEQNIIQKLDGLGTNSNKQADLIVGLEAKIDQLSRDVDFLKQARQQGMSANTLSASASSNVITTDLAPQVNSGMVTLGSLEKVYIDVVKSSFVARVDTGATTSSINAIDIQKFERDGKRWIKFHVSDEHTAPENRKWVEAPITRYVKIRQSSTHDLERRPVIELWVKIGKVHEKSQFTLTDRTQMDYPILLGREFIQDVALVDVSRDFIESKAPKKHSK
jgi:hypothetical protein